MGFFRLFLALAVVVGHNQAASTAIGPGVVIAVKAFFVVSGFYMALVLDTKYRGRSYGTFITSRFLRLYPLYILVVLLSLVLAFASPTKTIACLSISTNGLNC